MTWGVLFSFALMHLRHFNSNQIMNGTLQKLFTFKKSIILFFFVNILEHVGISI